MNTERLHEEIELAWELFYRRDVKLVSVLQGILRKGGKVPRELRFYCEVKRCQ